MTLPVLTGPLSKLEQIRPRLVTEVVTRSEQEIPLSDLLLGEALYQERKRLRRSRPNPFTWARHKRDRRLWSRIQRGLIEPPAIADRKSLLHDVLSHYGEEIAGHYDQGVYRFATHVVPYGFNWLLNAASVRHFVPWGMKENVQSRLRLSGEIDRLRDLSRRGTILLLPTHQSNIDSILIGYLIYLMGLPAFSYGAGLNLFSNPVLSYFMSNLGAYTVDRQKGNEIYKSALKNYSTSILREGIHSVFFPGGGRAKSGAIESHLKLGLLGTGLQAQLENLREGRPNPNIYVVPMVMSYHYVLEAAALIDQYLEEVGKSRFISVDVEPPLFSKLVKFFWKLFSSQSAITVRVGKPLDIFGNPVDEEGRSIGPNGTVIDPRRWLTTQGELRAEPQRDHQYVRQLGSELVKRFHSENTVLTSHLVAFSFLEALRKKYPDLDLFRFLRLSLPQRSIPEHLFYAEAEACHRFVRELSDRGGLHLSPELQTSDVKAWVGDGLKHLGVLHGAAVVKLEGGAAWTEDMNLLYYYRNRLTGYGYRKTGKNDSKGFLE